MSFCDFSEDVEDAIDSGCAYDDEETSKQDAPQLLWLSDIPLFQSIKAMKPGGHSNLTEEDDDSELQCTYQSPRDAYREKRTYVCPTCGHQLDKQTDDRKSDKQASSLNSEYDSDEDGDEWADTNVAVQEAKRGPDGKIIKVLEDTPDWYEKYSSFLCNKEPEVILLTLKDMFEKDDRINFEIPESHFQIRGSVHLEKKAMVFHINIFKDTAPNEYLVEFQRQSGGMLDFQALYRQSLAHLNLIKGMLVAKIHAKSTGTFNFSPIKQLSTVDTAESKEAMTGAAVSSGQPSEQLTTVDTAESKELIDALEECNKGLHLHL